MTALQGCASQSVSVVAEVRGQAGVWRLRQPDEWMLLLLLYVGVSTLSGETRLLLSPRAAWRQNNQQTRPRRHEQKP